MNTEECSRVTVSELYCRVHGDHVGRYSGRIRTRLNHKSLECNTLPPYIGHKLIKKNLIIVHHPHQRNPISTKLQCHRPQNHKSPTNSFIQITIQHEFLPQSQLRSIQTLITVLVNFDSY